MQLRLRESLGKLSTTRIEPIAADEFIAPTLGWPQCRIERDCETKLLGSLCALAVGLQKISRVVVGRCRGMHCQKFLEGLWLLIFCDQQAGQVVAIPHFIRFDFCGTAKGNNRIVCPATLCVTNA